MAEQVKEAFQTCTLYALLATAVAVNIVEAS
jgi:hypothetical protein